MADINLSPYTAEQQAMDRRRKMAEALQQQAIAPIEMPTVPGAKVSPYQGFAKLLQGYIAGKNLERADQEQKDYENKASGETADFLSKMSQYETVPGDIITPGQESAFIPENVTRYNETKTQPESFTPEERNAAIDLPLKTEAVPEVRGPSRQVPVLDASFLDPTKPYAYKTGQVKQMLMQVLMQQEAQKQAAAQRALEAQQAIHVGKPGETFFRIGADGKPITVANTPAIPSFEKVETINAKGQKIVKYVDKAKLGELGDVLAPYTGMIDHLMQAQNLPEVIKNNPDALRLVGSFLGKESGDVTSADFAKVMIGLNETNARLKYEGIPPVTTDIVKGKNIMIPSVDLPPQGSPLENGKVYNTPKGQARWNGTKFVTID